MTLESGVYRFRSGRECKWSPTGFFSYWTMYVVTELLWPAGKNDRGQMTYRSDCRRMRDVVAMVRSGRLVYVRSHSEIFVPAIASKSVPVQGDLFEVAS